MKKAIKICRREYDILVSAFNDGKAVEYKINEWTKRPADCGPLAVFKNKRLAKRFIKPRQSDVHFLFKCKYRPSKDTRLWAHHRNAIIPLPEGTIFADKVMILKEC